MRLTPAISLLSALAVAVLASPAAVAADQPGEAATFSDWRDQPDFIRTQLAQLATPGLASRQWPQVKIPGLREQTTLAHQPGQPRTWTNVSPGYANVIYDAKVDGGVITITLDGGSLAQSRDGGATWTQLAHDMTFGSSQSFDISPRDPQLIVATSINLDRTRDGGRSWSTIYDPGLPPPAFGGTTSFDRARFTSDGARFYVSLGSFGHGFAARGGFEERMRTGFGTKRLYVGDADASHFTTIELGPFAGIRCIYPHPTRPELLYASFGDGTVFVSRNANAAKPEFTQLAGLPEGYAAIDIDASPWKDGDLLLTMMQLVSGSSFNKVKVFRASDDGSGKLACQELLVKDAGGAVIPLPGPKNARWNPRAKGQVVISSAWNNGMVMSDDDGATFRRVVFPAEMKHAEPVDAKGNAFCFEVEKVYFDRKTDLALACSAIAGWTSTDQFKTWHDLLMTYDDSTKLYGNKGAGFAECGCAIDIRPSATYLCTNDHGIFKSNGADVSKWQRITPRGLFNPVAVSHDERYVYAFGRESSTFGSYNSAPTIRLFRSLDHGTTWQDRTKLLGHGDTLDFEQRIPFGAKVEMLFDPADAQRQWIMFSHHLFFSADGGESFKELTSPLFVPDPNSAFRIMRYDAGHRTLYVGNSIRFPGGSALARSRDDGATWDLVPLRDADSGPEGTAGDTLAGIKGLGITGSGALVLGLNGKLVVMPYAAIDGGTIERAMVKATVGDNVQEWSAMQKNFGSIACDGEDIVAGMLNGILGSNVIHGMGLLLSRDGGATFQWITHDLPCLEAPEGIAIGNGMIILGNRGVYAWRYK